jgi:hypothetical protein
MFPELDHPDWKEINTIFDAKPIFPVWAIINHGRGRRVVGVLSTYPDRYSDATHWMPRDGSVN